MATPVKASVEIPSGFEGWFRQAVAHELRGDGEWVQGVADEMVRRLAKSKGNSEWDELADVRGSARCLGNTFAVAEQLFGGGDAEKVEGDAEALAHITEAFVRQVIPSHLESVPGPIEDQKGAMEIQEVAEALSWGGKETARLHGLVYEGRKS